MDRFYRLQRHLYDSTRAFFLLGRNRLLEGLEIRPGMQVLEVGCGTARNLIQLAGCHRDVRFFGVDISREMLKTASRKILAAELEERVRVEQCAAEDVHHRETFGLAGPFDVVFFSYSLTMMPTYARALEAAREGRAAQGSFYASDFWECAGWPAPLRSVMGRWLSFFHVHNDPGILAEIERQFAGLAVRPLLGGYAFLVGPGP